MRCGGLHHGSVAWSLAVILYGCAAAFASDATLGGADDSRSGEATIAPHIALLLPSSQGPFARPAEALQSGFLAAARARGGTPLPIRIYAVADEGAQAVTAYRQALAAGARLVVGPLTRDGVSALVASNLVTIPTLALNAPEPADAPPPEFYTLNLQVEAEARQVAQLAAREGRLNALTVGGDTALMRRMHQAFVEEFTRLGGRHVARYEFTPDTAALARVRQASALGLADMAFLALDFQRARLARPYLGTLPVYATSQVNAGPAGLLAALDLSNVTFLDMPWMLQPDHPAVMVYPRADFPDSADLDRLYALGIDAFRVARALLEGERRISIDGVTGRLVLGAGGAFSRELTAARFADGKLLVSADPQ